jgi:hypothetical protein
MNTAYSGSGSAAAKARLGFGIMTKKTLSFDLDEIRMQQPQKHTADPKVAVLTMILTEDI